MFVERIGQPGGVMHAYYKHAAARRTTSGTGGPFCHLRLRGSSGAANAHQERNNELFASGRSKVREKRTTVTGQWRAVVYRHILSIRRDRCCLSCRPNGQDTGLIP